MAAAVAPDDEKVVLEWLLSRQDVKEAVDLAANGYDAMALPALVSIVRSLLGLEPTASGGSAPSAPGRRKRGADTAEQGAAEKRPKLGRRQPSRGALGWAAEVDWLTRSESALELELDREEARLESEARREREAISRASKSRLPLYWKIDLPDIAQILLQRGSLPDQFKPVERPHTTLLFLGGETERSHQAARAGLPREQFDTMYDALEALQGGEFEVRVSEVILESNIACAVVLLPPVLPCANKVPHVTLGMRPGTPAKYSNEVLEEVKAGRTEGITVIKLPVARPLKGKLVLEWA